jgi:tetratricopeptide (TPR) repeat protein
MMSDTPRHNAAPSKADTPAEGSLRPRKVGWIVVVLLMVGTAVLAWFRVGMLDLPTVPAGLTLETAGLADLQRMKQLNALIWSEAQSGSSSRNAGVLPEAAGLVRNGIAAYRRGDASTALSDMRRGIRLDPNNLVLANAYRMVVFRLRRDFLAASRRELVVASKFPPELDGQPIAFFEELDRQHASRETKLDLALAWVDEMLLFPALEIKAPASVQAVDLLTQVIDYGNPGYVPALFARGLNHLHRPARLVWPESSKTPKDAAARDIGRCVAIGRRLGVGSPRLQATLALSLGDAYVKAGRFNVARSWWQIAQNLCRDQDLQSAIRRRYAWQNEEILDRLEEELDRSRSELDHPMTDLAFMWN